MYLGSFVFDPQMIGGISPQDTITGVCFPMGFPIACAPFVFVWGCSTWNLEVRGIVYTLAFMIEQEEDRPSTFREWCMDRNIPFRENAETVGNILVRDEDMVPYYLELAEAFPKYFHRYDDSNEVPHSMN
jgi:hypothetical protein